MFVHPTTCSDNQMMIIRMVIRDRPPIPLFIPVPQLVDDLATRLHCTGRIADPAAGADFYTRLTVIEQQFPNASVMLHKSGILPRAVQRCVHICLHACM